MGDIFNQIKAERTRQDNKWGEQLHHPFKWATILGEEYGEVCKATLEGGGENYREELVQVAAVAVAAIESYDKIQKESTEEYIKGKAK